ncbi:MAG: hypothetical protein KGJ49_09670 [Alphaproteobacteria bacterium]|nr:hypothetical protein [Alphaproteobacteria bacterium]
MRRPIFAALTCAVLFSAAFAGDPARDNQSGSYQFTWVRQYNGRVLVSRQRIDAEQYNRLRNQLVDVAQSAAANAGSHAGSQSNTATLDQSGRGHFAAASQYGSNDSAAIRQSGAANTTYVNQLGSDLNASPSQSGDHNVTLIDQWNGAPAQPVWDNNPPRRYRGRATAMRNLD